MAVMAVLFEQTAGGHLSFEQAVSLPPFCNGLPMNSDRSSPFAMNCMEGDLRALYSVCLASQRMRESKETGETAHVERWKNTLRQRLARFVRKTLSFSKSLFMHDACLRLFLHHSHLERAAMLM